MRISVVNFTNGLIPDAEVQTAIRAVNRQISEDFAPYWNLDGSLRLEGTSGERPDATSPEDMQGEGIIYLWDESDVPTALGYHDANYRGIPYGFVFIDIATDLGEPWTVTFSHEVLELIGDRQANLLVQGPHPEEATRSVYHWREMCDAVQDETYEIDGVAVSNFVLPLYFTEGLEPGSRNDFLGTQYPTDDGPRSLDSFGVNPGGYIGYYDPKDKKHKTFMDETRLESRNETRAARRQERKNKARQARRGNRYAIERPAPSAPLAVPPRRKTRLNVNGAALTLRANKALEIDTAVVPLRDNVHRKGYFACDISADGGSVDQELVDSDFEEIAALSVEDPDGLPGHAADLELEIGHQPDEAVIALIEVDGVMFWRRRKDANIGTSSFSFHLEPNEELAGRRGFLKKITKTTIRLVKHKLVDTIKSHVKDRLDDYLAEKIEKLAFKKRRSARLHEFYLLRNPVNRKLGGIRNLVGSLQSGKKYLLFIHGIFSSSQNAFGEILLDRHQDRILANLARNYDKIISFDHWTVAKSTLDNADELLAMLPANCDIDIVCHSRGAGVTRCLLEHPQLQPQLNQKGIKAGKVIFVAGACQGSPLANPSRMEALVNVFAAFSAVSGAYFPLKLVTGLAKAMAYGVRNFPGIQAMSTNSPIIKALNQPVNHPHCEYIYMRSNYEPKGRIKRMFDEIGLDQFVFKGRRNDGVVPFHGAGTFDPQVVQSIPVIKSAEFGIQADEHVFHTQFFKQRSVRAELLKHLT